MSKLCKKNDISFSEAGVFIGDLQQTITWTLKKNQISHDVIPNIMARFAEASAAEIRAFVDCILEDEPVPVTGADARADMAIAVAATRSLDEGRPILLMQ